MIAESSPGSDPGGEGAGLGKVSFDSVRAL